MQFLTLIKFADPSSNPFATPRDPAIGDALSKRGVKCGATYWAPLGGRFDAVTLSDADDIERVRAFNADTAGLIGSALTYRIDSKFEEAFDPDVPVYLSLGRWTSRGRKMIEASEKLGPTRFVELRNMMLRHPVHLRSMNWIEGEGDFDVATFSQAGSTMAIARCRRAILAEGRIVTEIHPLVREDELRAMSSTD